MHFRTPLVVDYLHCLLVVSVLQFPLLLDVVLNVFNLDVFQEMLVVSYSMLLLAGDCSILWTQIPNCMHRFNLSVFYWLDPRLGEKTNLHFGVS